MIVRIVGAFVLVAFLAPNVSAQWTADKLDEKVSQLDEKLAELEKLLAELRTVSTDQKATVDKLAEGLTSLSSVA